MICWPRTPWDVDPRRWECCRAAARAAMLAEGWNEHAGKFMTVHHRRALRLWRQGQACPAVKS